MSGPKDVRLFVDRPNYSFSDAEAAASSQDIVVTKAQLMNTGTAIPLKFVKFQNVHSLTIFISSNQDDSDVTGISSIELFGFPIAGMFFVLLWIVDDMTQART